MILIRDSTEKVAAHVLICPLNALASGIVVSERHNGLTWKVGEQILGRW